MPKPSEIEPIPQQSKYLSDQEVKMVIDRLLQKQQSFSSLKLEDLGRYSQQTELDTNPELFVRQVLGAEASLTEEAYHRLLDGLPAPNEVLDLTHYENLIKNGEFISPRNEKKIREAILGGEQAGDSLEYFRLAALKETQELNKLIRSLSREIPGSHPLYDLDTFERDQAFFEMLSSPPRVLVPGGKPRYRLKLPISTDLYLVVDNDEDNAKVTDLLFQSPNLMAYFVAEQVQSLQQDRLKKVESIFADTSVKKHETFKQQSNEVNLAVRVHFLELLKEYCQERGQLTMVKIVRDSKDRESITEGKPPITDRAGIETFKETYTIKLDNKGRVELLMKTHSGDVQCSFEVVTDEQGQPVILLQTPAMRKSNVYCPLFDKDNLHRFDDGIQCAENLIDSVRVSSANVLMSQPAGVAVDLRMVKDALCAAKSVADFFQELRSVKSLYPNVEFALVKDDPFQGAFDEVMPPRSVWGKYSPN